MATLDWNIRIDANQAKRELDTLFKKFTSGTVKGAADSFFKGVFSDVSGGGGKKTAGGGFSGALGKFLGRGAIAIAIFQKISDQMNKVIKVLSESSTLLKASLNIGKQAFRLALKPFGDIIGVLLRPALIWLLKMAILFNKIFGVGKGEKPSEELDVPFSGEEKKKDSLFEKTKKTAFQGLFGGGAISDIIKGGGKIPAFEDFELPDFSGLKTFFTETIPGWAKSGWDAMTNFFLETVPGWAKAGWTVLETFFTETVPGWFQSGWDAVKTFFTVTVPGWAKSGWEGIKTFFTETVPGWIEDAWDGLKTFFTETVPGWFQTMADKAVEWIQGIIDKIPGARTVVEGVKNLFTKNTSALGSVFDSRSLVEVGERGPEAIIPLKDLQNKNFGGQNFGGGGGGGNITVIVQNPIIANEESLQDFVDMIKRELGARLRTRTGYGMF